MCTWKHTKAERKKCSSGLAGLTTWSTFDTVSWLRVGQLDLWWSASFFYLHANRLMKEGNLPFAFFSCAATHDSFIHISFLGIFLCLDEATLHGKTLVFFSKYTSKDNRLFSWRRLCPSCSLNCFLTWSGNSRTQSCSSSNMQSFIETWNWRTFSSPKTAPSKCATLVVHFMCHPPTWPFFSSMEPRSEAIQLICRRRFCPLQHDWVCRKNKDGLVFFFVRRKKGVRRRRERKRKR